MCVCVCVCVCVYHIFFIHASVDGHLGYFHNLAVIEITAINIGVYITPRISTPVFFGYIPSSAIAQVG